MKKKQVAIIDVGSSEIRAIVGERGVNNTFIIKGRSNFAYDGYADGSFFDINTLKKQLLSAGEYLKSVARSDVDTVYVGVPGAFTQVVVKGSQISFSKSKKINEDDVDKLFDGAFVANSANSTLINRSAVIYELNDFRRLANPIGVQGEILKGKLSFISCSNYFIEAVKPALKTAGFKQIEFVSSQLAQAMFLFDAEARDRLAILVDVGYISTTLSVIQGDGIVYQRSFNFGGGYVTASIAQTFDMQFDHAEALKRRVNLSQISSASAVEVIRGDDGKYYNVDQLKQLITNTLEDFCSEISDSLENVGFVIPEYVPLKISGGGIAFLRGAKQYVANRLGMAVETIAPSVPLMDNPLESASLSLLDIALAQ